jgi:NAD(P)-dependent dehydrogenase (short-subunit alcohol dehydrogenase family)
LFSHFETNYFGAYRLTQTFIPLLREMPHSRIVNISSVAGKLGPPFSSMYSSSKYAMEGWSESLRLELRKFNIHVTLINPGNQQQKKTLDFLFLFVLQRIHSNGDLPNGQQIN